MTEYPDLTKLEESFRAMLTGHERATRAERGLDRKATNITPFRLWCAQARAAWSERPEGKAAIARHARERG